jgi:hypothetical protein
LVLALGSPLLAGAEEPPVIEKFLVDGDLGAAAAAARDALKANANDDQARFGLGAVQFLQAVEHLGQSLHRYGLRTDRARMSGLFPGGRLPIGMNDHPMMMQYADLRAILKRWIDDLAEAESTLAKVTDAAVSLPLHLGRYRLDLDGDGKATEDESLWRIYQIYRGVTGSRGPANEPESKAEREAREAFLLRFDRGDVSWLRGYCHLLMALSEAALAYDGTGLFAGAGHLLFANVDTPYALLKEAPKGRERGMEFEQIADLITAIHLLRLPATEPKRLTASLHHLEAMIAMSKEMWKFVLAETDDDHEWIPNPKQHSDLPGGRVTDEMVQGWDEFLDETAALLAGRKLVPFWRGQSARGVNLKRVFTEPREFDLVLWVQGTAAAPYLEEGPVTRPEIWQRLQRVFAGEFIGFAFWFN